MLERRIRTFGRIKSRKLNENKKELLENLLPKFQIKIENEKIINIPNNYNKLFLEIGFGYGEHTIHQAKLNPDCLIIGCETYIKGVLSLLQKIENNIRIYNDDARKLLEKMPDNSVDKFFILFPDPWPKTKQNKRRLINREFLFLLKSKLKKGGTLFFASDILDYVKWTCNFAEGIFYKNFKVLKDCKKAPDWWIMTRYQNKAIKENRENYFLEFIK